MKTLVMTALAVVLAAQAPAALAQDRERGDRGARMEPRERPQGRDWRAERPQGDGGGVRPQRESSERRGGDGASRAADAPRAAEAPRAQPAPQAAEPRRWRGGGEDRARQEGQQPTWRRAPDSGQSLTDRAVRDAQRNTDDRRQWSDRRDGDRSADARRDWDRRDGRYDGDGRTWDRRDGDRRDGDRRDGDRRYSDRRDWDRDHDRWDGRRDYRRWERGRYPSVYFSSHRYRYAWRPPSGFYLRLWSYGDYYPRSWYGPGYWIVDPWLYDLPIPPPGYAWVRSGPDALLIDEYTGLVVQVVRDVFWY